MLMPSRRAGDVEQSALRGTARSSGLRRRRRRSAAAPCETAGRCGRLAASDGGVDTAAGLRPTGWARAARPAPARRPASVARQRLERVPAPAHEAGAEQEIARQIADQRELRRGREVGAGRDAVPERVEDQPRVAGEIADRRVDLQQRDFHVAVGGRRVRPAHASIADARSSRSFDRTTR